MTQQKSPHWRGEGNQKTNGVEATTGKDYPATAYAVNASCPECGYFRHKEPPRRRYSFCQFTGERAPHTEACKFFLGGGTC